ncbi:MAG: histidine phosphatase family protein [Propionibacteriaceae bacterium]
MPVSSATQRLLVLAHGPTADLREARFGGTGALTHPELLVAGPEPVEMWACGPEPACVATVEALGAVPTVVAELAGPRFGNWAGRMLVEVAETDPEAVGAWMGDPGFVPPGGESLTAVVGRVGSWVAALDTVGWSGVVVTPLVGRALLAGALAAPAALVLVIELPPGGRAVLTRSGGGRWRLRQLG